MTSTPMAQPKDRFWMTIIALVSALVCAIVAFLFLGLRMSGVENLHAEGGVNVSALPAVNASLNGLSTVLLLISFACIKMGRRQAHKNTMLAAFGSSAVFLLTYVVYHTLKEAPAQYTGDWTSLYYTILITHIGLAVLILPLALTTLYRGFRALEKAEKVAAHKKLARIALPMWLYVSVTGVTIYFMLY